MSLKNKKTLKVVFFPAVFVATAFLFSQANSQAITMREYIDMRIGEQQRAVDKAMESLNERLSGMNEFRASMADSNKTFATKETVDKIMEDVRELRSISDIAKGAATQGQFLISMIASFIGMVGGVLGMFSTFKKNNQKACK